MLFMLVSICATTFVCVFRDRIVTPITVEYEGFPREKTWTEYLCSEGITKYVI